MQFRVRLLARGFLLAALMVWLPLGTAHGNGRLAMPACAWAGETDQRDVNIGAPDLDAYYWLDAIAPTTGSTVVIHGFYPHARYFSFHVYDSAGDPISSIYDAQITADAGSGNPFRHRVSAHTPIAYIVHIVFGASPAHPAGNTIYVNPGSAGTDALLVYRVYVPQHPSSPSGDVPFPQVTIDAGPGASVVQGACATTPPAFGSAIWKQLADADYPSFAPTPSVAGAARIPVWQRSFTSKLANQQNAYLGALLSRQYGSLVVIHARVPTFPNTRLGAHVYGHYQVRYWSFCTYDTQGEAGFGCVADYGAAIRRGFVTYVISDPGVRPANAVARDGVTWLPWGGDQYGAQVVLRNMLPRRSFSHAVQRITPTSDPPRVMGAFYPQAVYCDPEVFALGGWRLCFRAAGVAPRS